MKMHPLTYSEMTSAISTTMDHCSGCGAYETVFARIFLSQTTPRWHYFCEKCELAIHVVLPVLVKQVVRGDLWCTRCGKAGCTTEHIVEHIERRP